MRRSASIPCLALVTGALAVAAAGCGDTEIAYGDVSSIIVGADPALWSEIGDSVRTALEPTVQTVRNEKKFQVTYHDPNDPQWGNFRKFRQLLLIGTRDDPWVQRALEDAEEEPGEPPATTYAYNVFARNQLVTILLLPEDDATAALGELEELQQYYDEMYQQWARNRMFLSGRDSALADTLSTEAGFTLLLPEVYRWSRLDSTFIFRNDNPDPSELIRQVAVTWRSPIPDDLGQALSTDAVLEWRSELANRAYEIGQEMDLELLASRDFQHRGQRGHQVQAVWNNPPDADWPAAGPFVTRAIACPEQDRIYLLDAWLYAPGSEKYEYILQLRNILDSFQCGGGGDGEGAEG